MLAEEKGLSGELIRDQIERILRSDEFRTSEVLRRLLVYLSDKAACGQADNLKEYVVAIEGLGKSPSYDPQHNSAVRIQVGRLRQKLAEYYRREGKGDPIVIDLPKGRFRLVYEERPSEPLTLPQPPLLEPPPTPLSSGPPPSQPNSHFFQGIVLGLLCGIVLLGAGFALLRPLLNRSRDASPVPALSPDLQSLWAPFLGSHRPLIVSIEDPLFLELHSNPGVYYRDRSLNQWEDVEKSPAVNSIRKALDNPDLQPSRYYTAFGEVDSSFMLGRLLGPHVQLFSISKASQLSWQQLADNNVVFVGVQNLFFDQAQGLPLPPQLVPVLDGVQNLHPAPGEPALYADQYVTAPAEQGVVYALVTHLPGPLGSSEVESFTSNRSAGYVGAVQWFTDPKFAKILVEKLKRQAGGRLPRYYQVVLKVAFKDDVPTQTTYVASRELR